MADPSGGAAALFRAVGLLPDGPAVLGRPIRAGGPGVYAVELSAPLPSAPIELTRVGKWLERVPSLRLDGSRPTSRALAARLASFWLPSRTVVFIGSTSGSIGGRLAALEAQVPGEPRPYPAAQWLRTLDVGGVRAWWSTTDAPEEYEDALLEAFAATVPEEERAALHDPEVVLPFANLRMPSGARKNHGISGAVLPAEQAPARPATRIVTLAPGDAEGARREERGTGTVRRAPREPRAREPRPAAARTPRPPAARATPPPPEAVELTEEGLARLRAEHDELVRVRRPEVIARIRAAKELGDLRENADYTAAREEQSFLEGRIQALEARLRSAVTAVSAADSPHVVLGSRVTVERLAGDRDESPESAVLTIVGPAESNPGAGRISSASPVGRALLRGAVGDEVAVSTPTGVVRYRIVALD
jgi:transcription elongation factor GreA